MSFNDIFKNSFTESISEFAFGDMLIGLAFAFGLGLFIFFVYKRTYKGVMYSASFGLSLVAMCVITALVIFCVTSNVVLSLGMVGALSIVRFRAAIKEPLDIAYLFWAITIGIVTGAGQFPLAVCGSLIIGGILALLGARKENSQPYVLMVSCGADCEQSVMDTVVKAAKRTTLKTKTVTAERVELAVELRLGSKQDTSFLNRLTTTPGIYSASLVSFNGDYTA